MSRTPLYLFFLLTILSILTACGSKQPSIQVGQRGRDARALVQSLQERQAKPEDHIPEFASLVQKHIDFIAEGLKNPANLKKAFEIYERREPKSKRAWKPRTLTALNLLTVLQHEANERLADEKVTHGWWVAFNFRLSALASFGFDFDERTFSASYAEKLQVAIMSHDKALGLLSELPALFETVNLKSHLDDFPQTVFLPTINMLDLADFNETRSTGGHHVGVANSFVLADGVEGDPFTFFTHDLFHAFSELPNKEGSPVRANVFEKNDWPSLVYREHAGNLMVEKRAEIDVVYFLWHHEEKRKLLFSSNRNIDGIFLGLKFCDGCDKGTILDFIPKDVVRQGREKTQEWLERATVETENFFYQHKPEMRKAA